MVKYEHLTGFHFNHGERDCYELARDFFRDNFELELPEIARPDDWWWNGMDLYRDYLTVTGFEYVDVPLHEIRPADVALIAIRSSVPNHCAIFLDENQILHHPYNRFSLVDQYKGIWRNNTCAIIRHPDVPDLRNSNLKTFGIYDYMPKHIQDKIDEGSKHLLQ